MSEEAQGSLSWLLDVVRSWGPPIFVVLMIRTVVFEPFRIPSGSMLPTLQIGDNVVVSKYSYGIWLPSSIVDIPFSEAVGFVPSRYEVWDSGDPQRGDIIVFRYPRNEQTNYIKRVVAIAGDTVKVRDNQIFINGEAQSQEYIDRLETTDQDCRNERLKMFVESQGDSKREVLKRSIGGNLSNMRERTINTGEVFVMGDNRDNSEDSRAWGIVREEQIKGKAEIVLMSWDNCSGGMIGSFRPDRFGHDLYDMVFATAEAKTTD